MMSGETSTFINATIGVVFLFIGVGLSLGLATIVISGGATVIARSSMELLERLRLPCSVAAGTTLAITLSFVYYGSWLISNYTGFSLPFTAVFLVGMFLMIPVMFFVPFVTASVAVVIACAWIAILFSVATALLAKLCRARKELYGAS